MKKKIEITVDELFFEKIRNYCDERKIGVATFIKYVLNQIIK